VRIICDGLSALRTISPGHRNLLDVLVQLACEVAMATTKEPDERISEDLQLQELMRATQHVDASDPLRQSRRFTKSCPAALIFVARHEPDLFPKPFARAIAHSLNPVQLWNVACGVDGLDVKDIDVERITMGDRNYLWESLDARTPNGVMELLIAPQVFSRILDEFEEKVKQWVDRMNSNVLAYA
jgi:hypothetical protein